MARSTKSTTGQAPKPKAVPGRRKRCQMADLDLIQTSTYVNYLGSSKIASHLDHTSHCQASLGTNRSKRCPDTPKPCRPLPALGGSTTLHPTPYTLNPTPPTLHPTDLNPALSTLHPTTLHLSPSTLYPGILHPQPNIHTTLHPAPSTLHPKILHPTPSRKPETRNPSKTHSLSHTHILSLSLSLSLCPSLTLFLTHQAGEGGARGLKHGNGRVWKRTR